MIPKLAPGQEVTAEKLNQVIDALNSGQIISSPDLAVERSPGGTRLSVPQRPRDLYAIIKEHPDRPRFLNGEVPDGEYEWAQVFLTAAGEFEEIEGQGLHSYYDVDTRLLFNPAYEMTGDKKIEVGTIVRMRPYQPIHEYDTEESEGRGLLRRYVFTVSTAAPVKMIEIQPDEGRRYGTANYAGVFDGKIIGLDPRLEANEGGDLREAKYSHAANVWILCLRETCESMTRLTYTPPLVGFFDPGEVVVQENMDAMGWFFQDDGTDLWIITKQDSPAFSGDAANLVVGVRSLAEATPSDVAVPQSTLDEEKVNLLPAFTRFKGLLVGSLDFHGVERPLYVIDEGPIIRQFEIPESADDLVQDPGFETWPLWFEAHFVDQPLAPACRIYRGSELDNDSASAHYVGVGRKSWTGHHGALGWAMWSYATKRWEIISAFFKTIAYGVVTQPGGIDFSAGGTRGKVEIWWKAPTGAPFTAIVASPHSVEEAVNWTWERLPAGSKVVLSFDRQENLWMIVGVQYPVMIDGTDAGAGFGSEVGKMVFDDVVPGGGVGPAYFVLTHPGGTRSITQVNVVTSGITKAFNAAQWAAVNTMSFQGGLMSAWT